jgi:excisionase family DNA binding protein
MEAQITLNEIPEILARHEKQIQELLNRIGQLQTEPEKPLTVFEAATFLNKEAQTIYGLVSKRKIPFCKNGRELAFFKSELVLWLKGSRSKNQELNKWLNETTSFDRKTQIAV